MVIEIVERTPDPETWSVEIDCEKCKTKYRLTGGDLKKAGFKADGGHWFDGTATSVDRAFVRCPECDEYELWTHGDLPSWLWRQIPHDD